MNNTAKTWYESLTKWERIRLGIATTVAGDVITRMIGAAVLPYILKEENK